MKKFILAGILMLSSAAYAYIGYSWTKTYQTTVWAGVGKYNFCTWDKYQYYYGYNSAGTYTLLSKTLVASTATTGPVVSWLQSAPPCPTP